MCLLFSFRLGTCQDQLGRFRAYGQLFLFRSRLQHRIRFLQQFPEIKMILSGMTELSDVEDNLRTFEKENPLTEDESAALFEQTWKEDFMTITPAFEQMKGNGLYQGTRWQYRWAVPVYADKMIDWVGADQLADELSEFFRRHLFNQGNEPDIQTPFMFNLFGHPARTDAVVHALLTDDAMIHRYGGNAEYPEPFVGRAFQNRLEGYAPEMDEDDGTMSAWYMFSQLGFYPVCLGTDRYELFTPLFDKAVLHLPGHDVKLIRKCAPASARAVTVDGERLPGFSITHTRLTSARKIVWLP